MSEPKSPQVSVELRPNGTGKVVVDGRDISNEVEHVEVSTRALDRTEVRISLPRAHVTAEGGQVGLDARTAEVVAAIGWVSPEETQTRYKALCNVLRIAAGDAPGWPTWDELIDVLRALAENGNNDGTRVDGEQGHGK